MSEVSFLPPRLTVIGTFFERYENTLPLFKRLYIDATRKPDEAFLMCETEWDKEEIDSAFDELYALELLEEWPEGLHVRVHPTPREGDSYAVIPYANKINAALDECTGDTIVYLDNNSDPKPTKFKVMLRALELNPQWGAVYCTQKRTGMSNHVAVADEIVGDGYCALNYTQVMHRKTADRWPLDMQFANPDLADGIFWRKLHSTFGDFYPVGGSEILDEHHIPDSKAAGL